MTYCITLGKIVYGLDLDSRPAPELEAQKPIVVVTDRDQCIMDDGEVIRLNTGADKGEYDLVFCPA